MPRPVGAYSEFDDSVTSGWSQDDIELGENWHTDWSSAFSAWDRWQGAPGDSAWAVEHAYGFPGPVIPQAYTTDEVLDEDWLLFRVGNRYFAFTRDPDTELRSLSLTSDPGIFGDPESHTRRTALTEGRMYGMWFNGEVIMNRRNRWLEQAERGGRPHKNFLAMYH